MCCSAWLHLLFLVDRLMLEESNFTWWMIIRGGEAISASCLAGELCTTKSHRCPNRLPALPASSNILPVCAPRAGYYCQSCADFRTCQNVQEACLFLHYLCAVSPYAANEVWKIVEQHSLVDRYTGFRSIMIRNQSTPPHWPAVCLLAAMGIMCQTGPRQSCHLKCNQ